MSWPALVALAAAGVVLGGCGGAGEPGELTVSRSVQVGDVHSVVPVSGGVAVGAGSIWVANPTGSIVRVNPASGRVEARIRVPGHPQDVAAASDAVWITSENGVDEVLRLDPRTNRIVARISLPATPLDVALGPGAVWVGSRDRVPLVRIDPIRNRVVAQIDIGEGPWSLATHNGAVWVADPRGLQLVEIDPDTNDVVRTIPTVTDELTATPEAVAVDDSAVWVVDGSNLALLRLDPTEGTLVSNIPLGVETHPSEVVSDGTTVWVITDTELVQVEASSGRVNARVRLINRTPEEVDRLRGLGVFEGAAWVLDADADALVEVGPSP